MLCSSDSGKKLCFPTGCDSSRLSFGAIRDNTIVQEESIASRRMATFAVTFVGEACHIHVQLIAWEAVLLSSWAERLGVDGGSKSFVHGNYWLICLMVPWPMVNALWAASYCRFDACLGNSTQHGHGMPFALNPEMENVACQCYTVVDEQGQTVNAMAVPPEEFDNANWCKTFGLSSVNRFDVKLNL